MLFSKSMKYFDNLDSFFIIVPPTATTYTEVHGFILRLVDVIKQPPVEKTGISKERKEMNGEKRGMNKRERGGKD